MVRPLIILAFAALHGVATGCGVTPTDVALFEIDSVDVDSSGNDLELDLVGQGFSPGQVGQLVLDGTLHSPGLAPRTWSHAITARATSDSRVHAVVPSRTIEAAGRSTFRGDARVVFDAHDGEGTVSGSVSGLSLDLRPRASVPRRDALGGLAAWGITPSDEPADEGLVIGAVSGIAAGSGLREGDRMTQFRGVDVHSLEDAVDAGEARVVAVVVRDGVSAPVPVSLTRASAAPATTPWLPIAVTLLLILLAGLPSRALGAWALALRAAWHHTPRRMSAQLALSGVLALLAASRPQVAMGLLLCGLLLRVLTSGTPVRDALRYAPLPLSLVAVGALGGASSATGLFARPALCVLLACAFSAAMDGPRTHSARDEWVATATRGCAGAALALTFAPASAPVAMLIAGALAAILPALPGSAARPCVAIAATFAIVAGRELGWVGAVPDVAVTTLGASIAGVLAVAAGAALIATRRRPLRVAIGL